MNEIETYLDKHRANLERMTDDALAGELELASCAPVTCRNDLIRAAAVSVVLLGRVK